MKQQSSLDERIVQIADILGKTPEEVTTILRSPALGIQAVDDIQYVNEGEFRNAIGCDNPDETKRPSRVQSRKAWAILTGKIAADTTDRLDALRAETGIDLKLGIQDIPLEALVKHFDPFNPTDRLTRELKKRYGTTPVVLFDPGTKTVNVLQTVAYMKRVDRGGTVSKAVLIGAQLVRPMPVGESPDQMVDEDPLFPGESLEEGCSIHNFMDWSKATLAMRQFCRILLEQGSVNPTDEARVAELQKSLEHGLAALQSVYKQADLIFRERESEGTLPQLRVKFGGKHRNDPFNITGRNRTT